MPGQFEGTQAHDAEEECNEFTMRGMHSTNQQPKGGIDGKMENNDFDMDNSSNNSVLIPEEDE